MKPTNPWLLRHPAAQPPTLRLFCLPHAGGGASLFRDWRPHLPPEVELVALQLPGRETRMREHAHTHLSTLLPALVDALRSSLDRGFVLFGHSMGALIAFELARELRRQGLPGPRHLYVSGHHAPQLRRQRQPLHALPQAEFIEELRRLQGTPEEILAHPELMELLSPRLRADFAICETYQYREEPPLACALSAYAGDADELDGSSLDAWAAQTRGQFATKRFRGGHFYLHGEQRALLAALHADLERLLAVPVVRPPAFWRVAHG